MIYLKIHDTENGSMVAMCDEALIDKLLSDGEVVLDIKTYNSFYKGKKVTKDEAKSIVEQAEPIYSANVIGKESIEVAISLKIVEKSGVLWIKDVPYAHSYSMD